MSKKKYFKIYFIILLFIILIAPAMDGMLIGTHNINYFEKRFVKSKRGDWDLKVTINEITFLYYDKKEDIAYYKIKYKIENIGNNIYIGYPKTLLKVHNEQWEIASWNWPGILPLLLFPAKNITIDKIQKIEYENERFLSGKTVDLETGTYDASGVEDINQSNNIGTSFGKYWENSDKNYIPSGNHLKASLLNDEWIEGSEVFNFPDKTVEIPKFSETYIKFVIPTFLSSERIGWIGVFINLFISTNRAFCNFSKEFFDIASLLALTVGELYLLFYEVIGTITAISKGKIIVTFALVSSFFATLATISETLERLFAEIKELPIDPNDPLRIALADSIDCLYSFLSTYPWNDDVTIKGEINNCKPLEEIRLSCRNVTDKNITGGPGYREIKSFTVNTTWNLKYLDGLLFRCCQVKFNSSGHIKQNLKSRKIFSYVAPGGSLKIISGFQNARSINKSRFDFLQAIVKVFPILKKVLSYYLIQPYFAKN